MADRIYLPSSGSAGVSPAFDAGWNDNSTADRVLASRGTKTNTSLTNKTQSALNAANRNALLRQYILPLDAGVVFTTSDTVKGQVRVAESNANANARSQLGVRIIASDNTTVRATLLALATANVTTPSPEWPISATNQPFPYGGAATLATGYVTVSGDYMVIEIGSRNGQSPGSSWTATGNFGDPSATGDLPEDSSTTTALVPWIEFSGSLDPVLGGSRSYIIW